MLSLKLFLRGAGNLLNLNIFSASYGMPHDALYCIDFAMFLSVEKQLSVGSFINKE